MTDPVDPKQRPMVEPRSELKDPARKLFVGVRVSVPCANALAAVAETLARRARDGNIAAGWVSPVSYHVTLKYLGWAREPVIAAVRDAVLAAVRGAPELKFRAAGLGAFPSIDAAAVLWAGIEAPGAAALAALAAKIEAATVALGFAPADHPTFHPHVTLARVREPRPVRELISTLSEQMFSETQSDAVTLFESETKSSSSVYKELFRIPFKTASEGPISGAERQTEPVHLGASHEELDTDDGWPRGQGPTSL